MTNKYHFIGIGGIGMSSLANILLEKNIEVSGSDVVSTPITERLKKKGATIFLEQSAQNISPSMNVVFSTDIKEDNSEYKAAVKLKCRMIHRSEMLLELMNDHYSLAISGTHGKTTTSALLAWVLCAGGLEPSLSVGGMMPQFNSNGKHGNGDHFVAEADESDGSFLRYNAYGAIVTNIGLDHMTHYKTESNLISSFKKFMEQVENSSLLFWCGDDKRLRDLSCSGVSYGFSNDCQLKCSSYRQEGWSSYCDIAFDGLLYSNVEVNLIGIHNILNAAGVFGMALRLGMAEEKIRQGLKTFQGVSRRCEKKGEHDSVLFIDDYAHHPTEIHTTLKAIREAVPCQRLIAIFQPHRFSRTKDCMGHYGPIFEGVDQLIITDIHSAGEPPIAGVSAQEILKEVRSKSKVSCRYVSRENIVKELVCDIAPKDVVVTLGAGNITTLGDEALMVLNQKQ